LPFKILLKWNVGLPERLSEGNSI